MKKLLTFLLIALVYGCTSEENAGAADENTFIRYFGTEDNNKAVLAQEVTDGYLLLSNSDITISGGIQHKIKVIKTDLFGHSLLEQNYPSDTRNLTAASFIEVSAQLPNPGYLIIGDSIKDNGTTALMLLRINQDGTMPTYKSISLPNATASLHGKAITVDPDDGNYIVLGTISSEPAPTLDMFLAKINSNDLSIMWSREYGAGFSTTINRIYYTLLRPQPNVEEPAILWGGSVETPNMDMRLVVVPKESSSTIAGANIGSPTYNEVANDFCKAFAGWTFVGSTNERGSEDIYVINIQSNSQVGYSEIFGDGTLADRGKSIDRTEDEGYVVLGEVATAAKSDDFTIIRLNSSLQKVWQYNYGGADRQEAASIRVTSDGSYLVFGTTYFINEEKLMLMKVNKDGKL